MTIQRYVSTASIVCSLAFGFTGSAFAADVTISGTGPDSTQQIDIDNSSEVTTTNTNKVEVLNANFQEAKTGKVDATENTSLGGNVGSGEAANANVTATTAAISNSAADCVCDPGGGNGGSNGGGSVGGGGSTGGAGGAGGGAGGGSVLGAATVGGFGSGAVLPEVGASSPVDVSALRAAWPPKTSAPSAALANGSRMFTAAMLIIATLLSLMGALGSAFYARRRQERV